MKRVLIVLVLLGGLIMSAFAGEYYRINSRKTRAYARPATSYLERVATYEYNDVVRIDAIQQEGNYLFARVAYTKPERWIMFMYLTPLTEEEEEEYVMEGKLSAGYPWAHFNAELARAPYYTAMYWITVVMALCTIILFFVLYNKAKDRKELLQHYLYGLCGLALLFWVFRFGTWQGLQIGVLFAAFLYPFSYTRLAEEKIMRQVLEGTVMIACLILSWLFLRQWGRTVMEAGFLSWLAVIILTIVNVLVSSVIRHPGFSIE